MRCFIGCVTVTIGLAVSAYPLAGQGIPVLQRNDLEAGFFGTFTFGTGLGILARNLASPETPPINIVTPSSNGAVGAQFNWAPAGRMRLYAEASYIAGGAVRFNQDFFLSQEPATTRRRSVSADTSGFDVQGGVQVLFPIATAPRFVPYATAGVGVIGFRGGLRNADIGLPIGPGQLFSQTLSDNSVTPIVGAGFRYYFTERSGLRLESSAYLIELGESAESFFQGSGRFGRFSFGVFYQLR